MKQNDTDEIQIAVTGDRWIGKGIGSISTLIRETLEKDINEIQIVTYSVSENSVEFLEHLDNLLARKTRVMMIVNKFSTQPTAVQQILLDLVGKYDNFVLKDFNPEDTREDLHAKLIVIDHSIALVGSANLTWKGMVSNHELMVKLTGNTASTVGELVDRLSRNCESISTNG